MKVIKDLTDLELVEEIRKRERIKRESNDSRASIEKSVIDWTLENLIKEKEKRKV